MFNEDVLKVVEDLIGENGIELLELVGIIIYNIIKFCYEWRNDIYDIIV